MKDDWKQPSPDDADVDLEATRADEFEDEEWSVGVLEYWGIGVLEYWGGG
jgi:hypothetical protein